jgi:hypothetical protein
MLDRLFSRTNPLGENKIKAEIGEDNYKLWKQLKEVKEMINSVQARLPFRFEIH